MTRRTASSGHGLMIHNHNWFSFTNCWTPKDLRCKNEDLFGTVNNARLASGSSTKVLLYGHYMPEYGSCIG